VEEVAREDAGLQVAGLKTIGGRAVGDETALATRCDQDADPPGPLPGDAPGAEANALVLEGGGQRPPFGITTDGADERRSDSEPRQPAGGRRRRASLAQPDPTRHVGPGLERTDRGEHDVDHQVAEDDDAWSRRPTGTTTVGEGSGHQGEDSRWGRRPLRAYNDSNPSGSRP
jgi:hypothetical protein